MTGKKGLLARALVAGRFTPIMSRLRSMCFRDLPILAYHRVWDVDDEDRFAYDVELISASVSDFGWQMEYVRRNFTPITFATLGKILDGEAECPRRPIIVTFDDGYDDNYLHAFPVLHAMGIPATMFISTGYIGTAKTYWYDHLSHLLLTTKRSSVFVAGLNESLELGDVRSRRVATRRLLSHLKRVPNDQRLATIDELDASLDGDADRSATFESGPMTWQQVCEMSAAGIEIGSHSESHPILANVSDGELHHELDESKRSIQSYVRRPVTAISYPVGGTTAFDNRVCAAVKSVGYRFGVAYVPGTNPMNALDHFGLRRLHVERYTDRAYFASMLNLPEVFG
ncbi:MAG: polysaccharide deacetylase family protein [Planctomycetales bacterium]|nr:polysaccharide deacetylase family protein [Planctomycetales bacterium]